MLTTRWKPPSYGFPRRALTLVEVLVVMAVVIGLAALLLSGVLAARRTAMQAQCGHHQRQLVLASQMHHDAKGFLPAQMGWSVWGNGFAELTPYYEHASISVKLDLKTWESKNFEMDRATREWCVLARPELLVCPADDIKVGAANVAMNCGFPDRTGALNGVWTSQPIRLSDITDGLSQTVSLSEHVVGGRLGTIWTSAFPLDQYDKSVAKCRTMPQDEQRDYRVDVLGLEWWRYGLSQNGLNYQFTPNQPSCMTGPIDYGIYTASSHHGGGVNVAFVDGHVQFVSDSIAWETWRDLWTRAGG